MTRVISELAVGELVSVMLKHQQLQQAAIRKNDVPAANRHFGKVRECVDELATSPQGRDALENLLSSSSPFLRLWAAQSARSWAPEAAIPVLGRLLTEKFEPELSVDERLELRTSAKHSLYTFFGISSFDPNDLIEPLRRYGVDLPYRDHSQWQ